MIVDPILKKQKGFVDEIVFVSDQAENRVLALAFWMPKRMRSNTTAPNYEHIHEMIRHLLESEPVIHS